MVLGSRGFKRCFSRIGLDLGTSHVKIIQFKREGKRISLHSHGILPLPAGTVENGRIMDGATLAKQLKTFLKQKNFKKKAANICIGNQNVILRSVTLPRMSPKEIAGAIQWESEKYIMQPAGEVVTDYAFNREAMSEGRQVTEIELVAAPGKVVREYIEAVAQAGLNPETVEVEPFSLNRAVQYLPGRTGNGISSGLLLLLDIGWRCSNLLIMENGEYAFSRSLALGVNHFCSAVAAANNINMGEAAELIFGGDPFSAPGFRDVAEELADLVNSSAEYYVYRVRETDMNFRHFLLSGGGASIKDLGSFLAGLSGNFNVEPKTLGVFDYIRLNNNGFPDKDKLLFGVAAGLALRGWAFINEKRN